ncbi:unnamed protein product, partial [Urochloa humidicola]
QAVRGRNRGRKKAQPTDRTEAIKARRAALYSVPKSQQQARGGGERVVVSSPVPPPHSFRRAARSPSPICGQAAHRGPARFATGLPPELAGFPLACCRRWLEMTHMFPREGASSSSTSMSSQKSETDDDRMIAMVLSEEYAKLDGAMAKRLTNLTSIPHVPRINTYFPTYSDATMDHYRLLDRLNAYGLFEVRVAGDGNCQFRALSDQLYRSPDYHKHVRKEIVKQLKEHNSLYEGYVPMKYKHYCKKMKKSGEWGDHVTLQAAADKRFG